MTQTQSPLLGGGFFLEAGKMMKQKKHRNQGFKRLWLRGVFRDREFHQRDYLNEYDEDYSRLESDDHQPAMPAEPEG